jgi:hypothetical protein
MIRLSLWRGWGSFENRFQKRLQTIISSYYSGYVRGCQVFVLLVGDIGNHEHGAYRQKS